MMHVVFEKLSFMQTTCSVLCAIVFRQSFLDYVSLDVFGNVLCDEVSLLFRLSILLLGELQLSYLLWDMS